MGGIDLICIDIEFNARVREGGVSDGVIWTLGSAAVLMKAVYISYAHMKLNDNLYTPICNQIEDMDGYSRIVAHFWRPFAFFLLNKLNPADMQKARSKNQFLIAGISIT